MKTLVFSLLTFLLATTIQAQQYTLCGDYENKLCDANGNEFPDSLYSQVRGAHNGTNYVFLCKQGLWGMIDMENGREIFPFEYKSIVTCYDQPGIYMLRNSEGFFFYDLASKKNLTPVFEMRGADYGGYFVDGDAAYVSENKVLLTKVKGKWGGMTFRGEVKIPYEYDRLEGYYSDPDGFMIASRDGKFFIADSLGKPRYKEVYDDIVGFWSDTYMLAYKQGKAVFIRRDGKEMSEPELAGNYASFEKNGLIALFDLHGRNITGYQYKAIMGNLYNGYFQVANADNLHGVIDSTGKLVVPCKYANIDYFGGCKELLFIVNNDKAMYGVVNLKGEELIPLEYENMYAMGGCCKAQKDGKTGYINAHGVKIVDCLYEAGNYFNNTGPVGVMLNGKWGCVDSTGKTVTPFVYENISYYRFNRARAVINGKTGYLDETGKRVIECVYQGGEEFSELNIARVKQNEKWGCIDKNGKIVIALKYDKIGYFYDGKAKITLNGKDGFVDLKGKETW